MTEAAKEARREYKRQWARENREKVREHNSRYWEKRVGSSAAADDREQKTVKE